MKNKPAAHVHKGDKLVFKASDGREFRDRVSKISSVDYDPDLIKVHFPPRHAKLASGGRFETLPGNYLLFHRDEQVLFED